MSLLEATFVISGSITVIAIICGTIWLFYDLIKTTFEEPSIYNVLGFIVILCVFTFGICGAYIKYNEKDTTEYQQYLELKAKYEKDSK
jgi:hypothetical protein|nr:MAG TPA: SMODS and SLOG-associating 2TM effector domain 6 [Caudoviricetes sp.]